MNPFPVIIALFKRHRSSTLLFTALVALAVALGIAITSQERALREGSTRAADKFDLIVAAPGSQTDLLMSIVYLRPTAVELMPPEDVAEALTEERAEIAAPIAFGDSYDGRTIIGTTAAFVRPSLRRPRRRPHVRSGGRSCQSVRSSAPGDSATASSRYTVTARKLPLPKKQDQHGFEIEVVGRMNATGTPWDECDRRPGRACLVCARTSERPRPGGRSSRPAIRSQVPSGRASGRHETRLGPRRLWPSEPVSHRHDNSLLPGGSPGSAL